MSIISTLLAVLLVVIALIIWGLTFPDFGKKWRKAIWYLAGAAIVLKGVQGFIPMSEPQYVLIGNNKAAIHIDGKSGDTMVLCSMPALRALMFEPASVVNNPAEADSLLSLEDSRRTDSIKRLGQCIDQNGIAKSAFDSAMVAVAIGNDIAAMTHLAYVIQYANDDSALISDVYLLRGIMLAHKEDYLSAIHEFDSALVYIRMRSDVWNNRGLALCRLEKYPEAIASVEEALKYQNNNAAVWNNAGIVYYYAGEYTKSAAAYRQALGIVNSYPDAWYNLGLAMEKLDSNVTAIAYFDSALVYGHRYPVIVLRARALSCEKLELPFAALEAYDRTLQIRDDLPTIWFARGNVLSGMGRRSAQDAIRSYRKALFYKRDYAGAWYNLANTYSDNDSLELAVICLDAALFYDSSYFEAWCNKGVALGRLGQHNEALKCFEHARYIRNYDPKLWFDRGIALGKLGYIEDEVASYDSALFYNRAYGAAWYNRAEALRDLERFPEAIMSAESAATYDTSMRIDAKKLIEKLRSK